MSDKINRYKITKACIGCSACAKLSNSHFAMNAAGKAVVTVQPKTKEEENLCADAAALCPVSAISIEHNDNSTDEIDAKESNSIRGSKKIRVAFLNSLRRVVWFKHS